MEKVVCLLGFVPLRSEPRHASEMVNQLIFGEECWLLYRKNDWLRIKVISDGYEGWCPANAVHLFSDNTFWGDHTRYAAGLMNQMEINGEIVHIPFGSVVPHKPFKINDLSINYSGEFISPNMENENRLNVIQLAKILLNVPYLWGGKSSFGIDCSGLVQTVFKCVGKLLPRDAYQQAEVGTHLGFLEEGQTGDLAFFGEEEGKITHVGILMGDNKIIHASGKVRVDDLDHMGIINRETGKRTHNLRLLRSVI